MSEIKYIIDTPNSVSIDKSRFSELCQKGCKVYNTKWSCPPYSGTFFINQWTPFHVVILWMNNHITAKNEYTKVKAINSILKSRLYKLLSQYPNYKVLGSGSCRLCKKCHHPVPCHHPDRMIYSMESMGIDVVSICKSLGHELIWYQKEKPYLYGSVVGLIGDNNKDSIEAKLRTILYNENQISPISVVEIL